MCPAWRQLKPTLTFTYGLGYQIEMPPTEANGKQVELVDTSGKPIDVQTYLNNRQSTALAGGFTIPRWASPPSKTWSVPATSILIMPTTAA